MDLKSITDLVRYGKNGEVYAGLTKEGVCLFVQGRLENYE